MCVCAQTSPYTRYYVQLRLHLAATVPVAPLLVNQRSMLRISCSKQLLLLLLLVQLLQALALALVTVSTLSHASTLRHRAQLLLVQLLLAQRSPNGRFGESHISSTRRRVPWCVHNVPRQQRSPEQFHERSVRIYIAVLQ
jgi:hypothetical protein